MVTLSQGNNVSAEANLADLISKQGIHFALIIHNFLNMPHAPVCPFVEGQLTLCGVALGKKAPKVQEGVYPSFSNNPPFLHSPDLWKSVYMHLCIYVCLHEFPDDFSGSVPLNELFYSSSFKIYKQIFPRILFRWLD